MNKLTKGSIAAGAGLVLLLGGAGTFMSWNAETELGEETITAGHITISDPTATWTVNGTDITATISDYTMAPGDEVIYAATMNVEVEGNNLTVSPVLSQAGITGDTESAEDAALAAQVAADTEVNITGNNVTGTNPDFIISEGTSELTVTATLDFDFAGATNDSMTGTINLDGMGVDLVQNANPA